MENDGRQRCSPGRCERAFRRATRADHLHRWRKAWRCPVGGGVRPALPKLFGRPIIAIGRPETACVLAPLVDQFVPLDASADWHGKLGGASALAALPPTVKGVIGDLHLCHGNRASLDLVAAIAAPQTVLYDGWIDRSLQAPIRNWPHRSLLVSSLHKPTGTDPDRRHVLLDLAHYHRAVLDAFGIHAAVPSEPWLPDALKDKTVAPQFGLSKATIVCHIESSQRKRIGRWHAGANCLQRFLARPSLCWARTQLRPKPFPKTSATCAA